MNETIALDELKIGTELGVGGQASVYELPDFDDQYDFVFKRYKKGLVVDRQPLEKLVALPTNMSEGEISLLEIGASFPTNVVEHDGEAVGVIIPRAPSDFVVEIRDAARLCEVQFLTHGERSSLLGLKIPGANDRVSVCHDLARLLAIFHRHGLVHGDLSHKNVLWSCRETARSYLLDCDGAILGDRESALPQVTTPLWTDPRVVSGDIARPDTDSDVLGLALMFYRAFFQQRGDITRGLNLPIPAEPEVGTEVRGLLEATFVSDRSRPSMETWASALQGLSERQEIRDIELKTSSGGASASPFVGEPAVRQDAFGEQTVRVDRSPVAAPSEAEVGQSGSAPLFKAVGPAPISGKTPTPARASKPANGESSNALQSVPTSGSPEHRSSGVLFYLLLAALAFLATVVGFLVTSSLA